MAAPPPLPDGAAPGDKPVPNRTIVPNGTVLPNGAAVAPRPVRPYPAPYAQAAYPTAYPAAQRTTYPPPHPAQYPTGHSPYPRPPYRPYPGRSGDHDGLALAGFLFALFAAVPIAAVLCVVALRRVRRTGDQGRGLAIAGLAVSAAWVLLVALVVVVAVAGSADRDSSGRITDAGSVGTGSLRAGDCLRDMPEEVRASLDAVPCDRPHRAQVVATFALPGGEYPGRGAVAQAAAAGCAERLTTGLIERIDEGELDTAYLYPLADRWRFGERDVVCFVTSLGGPMVGEAETASPGVSA
jgi:hypothetical protein